MNTKIPYAHPSVNIKDYNAVREAMDPERLTQGPIVTRFEEAICEYTGANYCVVCTSGSVALESLRSLFITDYEETPHIFISPITYKATFRIAPRYLVRCFDISLYDYNACGATIGVDLAGRYCDGGVVVDSAHSFNRDMPMENIIARALSFHAIKNITTLGEGGAVITNDQSLADEVRHYVHQGVTNARMTEAQAAMGLSQLKRADRFKARKDELTQRYNEKLAGIGDLVLPKYQEDIFWHLYIVRTTKRDGLQGYLRGGRIETQINYKPIWEIDGYEDLGGDFPNAKEYGKTALSLPLFADMTRRQQNHVIDCIRRFYD